MRYCGKFFYTPKKRIGNQCRKDCRNKKRCQPSSNSTLTPPLTEMAIGTIEFKCIRINVKKISTFAPDESQIDSLIEFDLRIGGERFRNLSAEVRQPNGTDFQCEALQVGNVVGYDGLWNDDEFREYCVQYYRDVIGSCGVGRAIKQGQRKLVERVAIRLYRREVIDLSAELFSQR